MQITWDEAKRHTNIAKHGMDFADRRVAFFEAATIYPAKAGRLLAIGELFRTIGSEAMRPASRKERSL